MLVAAACSSASPRESTQRSGRSRLTGIAAAPEIESERAEEACRLCHSRGMSPCSVRGQGPQPVAHIHYIAPSRPSCCSTECPQWVISGHRGHFSQCPLHLPKRTSLSTVLMSAECQTQTSPRVEVFRVVGSRRGRSARPAEVPRCGAVYCNDTIATK
jgi:hypothetical protein